MPRFDEGLARVKWIATAIAIAGCGGAVDDAVSSGRPASTTPAGPTADEAVHVSDYRNVLPHGSYRMTVTAASCNVNELLREPRTVLLLRGRAGEPSRINIPLPWEARGAIGMPRQDFDLATGFFEYVSAEESTCRGGTRRSARLTERTASRMKLSFEEEGLDCEQASPLCTIEATFELLERACDPACDPTSIRGSVVGDEVRWTCFCKP